jgi:hypothetical protein
VAGVAGGVACACACEGLCAPRFAFASFRSRSLGYVSRLARPAQRATERREANCWGCGGGLVGIRACTLPRAHLSCGGGVSGRGGCGARRNAHCLSQTLLPSPAYPAQVAQRPIQ